MIEGAPPEARWVRPEPRRACPPAVLEAIVARVFPGHRLRSCETLSGGLRNTNLHLRFDGLADSFVLRLYEHDASICAKEIDLHKLIRESIPVAELLDAESSGPSDLPPFAVFRYVEGITFHQLKRAGNQADTAAAARRIGQTLARLSRFSFPRTGWLAPGPQVAAPLLEGPDPVPRFADLCLASPVLQPRLPLDTRARIHERFWQLAPQLAALDRAPRLVHGDFGKRNIIVRREAGQWVVAAILDWEFAIAASPLNDIGHLLRYERRGRPLLEPHFTAGFSEAGGELPPDWRRLSRTLEMMVLCENLTHEDLPGDVAAELIELVTATAADRDAVLP